MLIQCLIEREGGSEVSFSQRDEWPAGVYHFKPDPARNGSPHVCEVTEPAHVNRLLGITDTYRAVIDPSKVKKPTADAGVMMLPPKQPDRPDAQAQEQAPDVADGMAGVEDAPDVQRVREMSVRDLKSGINQLDDEVLRQALESEKARKDEQPRKSWIAVVEAHLGA